jgi:hypothetical protein
VTALEAQEALGRALADPTLYGPASRREAWAVHLARPPEPGEGCACGWCARVEPEPAEPLPDGHRETD